MGQTKLEDFKQSAHDKNLISSNKNDSERILRPPAKLLCGRSSKFHGHRGVENFLIWKEWHALNIM
jgi:hypothetical protein